MEENNYDAIFFEKYTKLVSTKSIGDAFALQADALTLFCNKLSPEVGMYSYAEGKWTLKEMMQHVIDTERIFCYRALCIARGEKNTLIGYNENEYASQSFANNRTTVDLADEMYAVRKSTIHLYTSFTPIMLQKHGRFSNASNTVQGIGIIIIGHLYHHIKIADERYFIKF